MQLPSSHFTLILEMAPDYTFNSTGPAEHNTDELLVTYCTFILFLLLFIIPLQVQITSLYQ